MADVRLTPAEMTRRINAYVNKVLAGGNKDSRFTILMEAKKKLPGQTFSLTGKPILINKLVRKNTLSIRDILKNTPLVIKTNAVKHHVTLNQFVQAKKSDQRFVSLTTTYEDKGRKTVQRRHKHRIVRLEPEKPLYLSKVKISCDCAAFMYMFEYALARRGNSEIIHTNGLPPYDKNPQLIAAPCKHLWVVLRYILANKLDYRQGRA